MYIKSTSSTIVILAGFLVIGFLGGLFLSQPVYQDTLATKPHREFKKPLPTNDQETVVAIAARRCGDKPIDPHGVQLAIRERRQQCDSLCWAADIEMVASYYNIPITQCELANRKLGDGFDCCTTNRCPIACNKPATDDEVKKYFEELRIATTSVARPLMEEELQLELSNSRPVIVHFGYTNTYCLTYTMDPRCAGHVAIVSGFVPKKKTGDLIEPATYTILDSSYDQTSATYEQLLAGPASYRKTPWITSQVHIILRPPDCPEGRDPVCECPDTTGGAP